MLHHISKVFNLCSPTDTHFLVIVNLTFVMLNKFKLPRLHLIFSQSDYLIRVVNTKFSLHLWTLFAYHPCHKSLSNHILLPDYLSKITGWVANNVDPDQTPRFAASDQGLHCCSVLPVLEIRANTVSFLREHSCRTNV